MTVRDSAVRSRLVDWWLDSKNGSSQAQSLGATRPKEGTPMSSIVPPVRFSVKQKLLRHLRQCRDGRTKIRYLIIINLLNGRGAYETAEVLGIHNTTVYRVADRFSVHQEAGLLDARGDNGEEKLSEAYLATLYKI